MDIPQDKTFPRDSVQCDLCGGQGCEVCDQKGWFTPADHPYGRVCERGECPTPIHPESIAIYCTDECAILDA